MPSVTGLGHVGLYVQDMPKMVDFYSNFLGLKVTDVGLPRIVFMSARPELSSQARPASMSATSSSSLRLPRRFAGSFSFGWRWKISGAAVMLMLRRERLS